PVCDYHFYGVDSLLMIQVYRLLLTVLHIFLICHSGSTEYEMKKKEALWSENE
ncbi:hypothetical protein NQZ68_027165, partial [Dissostichus eleginoides]